MDSTELHDAFREDVVDVARPYLWSEREVYSYANDAYRMFVRLTGGVADFTSDAASAALVAGDSLGVLDPSVLHITKAQRRSDGGKITIINYTDLDKAVGSDYGQPRALKLDDTQGVVTHGVIGMQRGIIRWLHIPEVDDTADMMIYRLPLNRITEEGQPLCDVDEDHHLHLLDWMKHLAYRKQDADTLNLTKAEECKRSFEEYCTFVKAEWERYKHKNREVSYGGL